MGLLDLIPVVIGAGIILKTTEAFIDRRREVESIHDRARRKAKEVV